MGIVGCMEDLVPVVLKSLEPGAHVGSVGVGVVGDAALRHQEDAGQFGAQPLLGIVKISKAVTLIQRLPVQPLGMATPMGEFVKGGSVVVPGSLEGRPCRKVNAVGPAVV